MAASEYSVANSNYKTVAKWIHWLSNLFIVEFNEFACSLNRNCNTYGKFFELKLPVFDWTFPFNYFCSINNLQEGIHEEFIFNKFSENMPEWFAKS